MRNLFIRVLSGDRRRSIVVEPLFVAAIAIFATSCLWAQDGAKGALSEANLVPPASLAAPFGPMLAIADFDHDNKPDGAVLVGSGRVLGKNNFRIELHLTDNKNSELTFESTESRLSITALDINNDGATDVIVEQPFTHRRLHVWLNDGHGRFHEARIEDFPPASMPNGERLESASLHQDNQSFCLPPQRGAELAKLSASSWLGSPTSTGKFEALSAASPAASIESSSQPSRAPPSAVLESIQI